MIIADLMVPELVEGYREAISTRRLFAGEERGVKREGDFFYPLRQAQGPGECNWYLKIRSAKIVF